MAARSTHYDALICGAGPAGSTAALVLARSGARVLLLDRAAFPRDKPCAEYLSPEVNVLLRELDLTHRIAQLQPPRLRGFHVYTQRGGRFTGTFAGASGGVRERSYGLAVPRTAFDLALLGAAAQAGAEVVERTRIVALTANTGRGATVRVAGAGESHSISASYVIAADGLRSRIARDLGLLRRRPPYRIALVTHMEGITGLDHFGEMHLSPAGCYCGVAPLGGGLANVSLVVDERAGRAVAGDLEGYLRRALATFPNLARRTLQARLARPVLATSSLSWSARRLALGRVALVGDAAGYYDPFTGEGIYKAIAGGRLAGRCIIDALAGIDPDDALARYERALRRLCRGKHAVERIVDAVVHNAALFQVMAHRLHRHADLADILVGVTGDFVSPCRVLNPVYVARLIF